MPLYRSPEERASETITIRLTIRERRMLDHLAKLDEKTLTDFIRGLIFKRAEELDIDEPPPPAERRRPGRPKMKKPALKTPSESPTRPLSESAEPMPVVAPPLPRPSAPPPPSPVASAAPHVDIAVLEKIGGVVDHRPVTAAFRPSDPETRTVGDLIERFEETFVHRAEGTKREFTDAMAFFFSGRDGPPIIDPSLPVALLTADRLKAVRDAVKSSDLRLAKKNLHLTYFRMLLHFAVKEPGFDLRVNPSRELEPLTITESNESWRFFTGPPR